VDTTVSTTGSTGASDLSGKAGADLPTLSAEELHLYLLKAFTVGNRAKRKLIDGLLHLHESRFYLLLGYSSIFQYAEKFFGYQRTETYEALRVGKALRSLSRSAAAFRDGGLSYSSLREITRVASEETEGTWLEFARGKSCRALKAEVEDALKKKRKLPREDRYGLPSLPVRVTFELSPIPWRRRGARAPPEGPGEGSLGDEAIPRGGGGGRAQGDPPLSCGADARDGASNSPVRPPSPVGLAPQGDGGDPKGPLGAGGVDLHDPLPRLSLLQEKPRLGKRWAGRGPQRSRGASGGGSQEGDDRPRGGGGEKNSFERRQSAAR